VVKNKTTEDTEEYNTKYTERKTRINIFLPQFFSPITEKELTFFTKLSESGEL